MQSWEEHQGAAELAATNNGAIREAFGWADSPARANRGTYKSTDCGASLGFRFKWLEVAADPGDPSGLPTETWREEWVYGDDLRGWGTWDDVDARGAVVTGFLVSSIVEGSEACVDGEAFEFDPSAITAEEIEKRYDADCQAVEEMADEIWREQQYYDYEQALEQGPDEGETRKEFESRMKEWRKEMGAEA